MFCGASGKDAGKKLCAINVILESSMNHPVIDKLLLASDKQIESFFFCRIAYTLFSHNSTKTNKVDCWGIFVMMFVHERI